MAFTAIGAAVGAGAVSAGVAVSTVVAVGAAAAVVGKITKSSELTKLGMGGMLGGAGAGWAGLGEAGAVSGGEAAAMAADEAVASGGGVAGSYAGGADAAATAAGGVEAYSVPTPQVQDLTAAAPEQVTAVNASANHGVIGDAMTPPALEPVNPLQPAGTAQPATGMVQQAAMPAQPTQAPQVDLFDHVREAEKVAGLESRVPTSTFWEKVNNMGQWMEKNKALTYAGVMLGGGVLSGIQKQQELDRYFDLKNEELGLQKQIAHNRSTTYRPGVISAARG